MLTSFGRATLAVCGCVVTVSSIMSWLANSAVHHILRSVNEEVLLHRGFTSRYLRIVPNTSKQILKRITSAVVIVLHIRITSFTCEYIFFDLHVSGLVNMPTLFIYGFYVVYRSN